MGVAITAPLPGAMGDEMSIVAEYEGVRANYNAAFEEGAKACEDGAPATSNPYDDWPGPLRNGWRDGFAAFQVVLRDGWEEENHQRARIYAEQA